MICLFSNLGREDPLEKEMETYSNIPAWRIPWTERGAWQITVHGVAKSWTRLKGQSTSTNLVTIDSGYFFFFVYRVI